MCPLFVNMVPLNAFVIRAIPVINKKDIFSGVNTGKATCVQVM